MCSIPALGWQRQEDYDARLVYTASSIRQPMPHGKNLSKKSGPRSSTSSWSTPITTSSSPSTSYWSMWRSQCCRTRPRPMSPPSWMKTWSKAEIKVSTCCHGAALRSLRDPWSFWGDMRWLVVEESAKATVSPGGKKQRKAGPMGRCFFKVNSWNWKKRWQNRATGTEENGETIDSVTQWPML